MTDRRRWVSSFVVLAWLAATAPAADLGKLQVLDGGYPRAYFFRASESPAGKPDLTYERWEASFSRLMGIEGKVLREEIPGYSDRNIEYFTRFKRQHPEQLVLLHYNGNARDPRYQAEKFFAGHFLYYNGAKIVADVPATAGETEIVVDNPLLFRTEIGRYRNKNDDIGLCMLDDRGRPDWTRCEQVELLSVDRAKRMLRVRRGCHGTRPLAFPAGKAYAAAHMTEGPWGSKSNMLWFYNYATTCPRDAQGRQCADIHAEELAKRFLPGGELAAFDGLEFDVLGHSARGTRAMGADCDADGQPDLGVVDGKNVYGSGVVEFCRQLRAKLGPSRLIMADGMGAHNQRAFGILNGIESEGWPTLSDWAIRDWSGGLNRHYFWSVNAAEPVFNYINHKFVLPGDNPGVLGRPEVPMGVHRLVFAVGMFTDSAICYAFAPPADRDDELIGIWDELRKGRENELGWLGKPLQPAVKLAAMGNKTFDLAQLRAAAANRLSGEGLAIEAKDGRIVVAAKDRKAAEMRFTLSGIPCDGADLTVLATAKAAPSSNQPAEVARMMWVGIAPPTGRLVSADDPPSGMRVRGGKETPIDDRSGAAVGYNQAVEIAGEAHNAYRVHPPYKGKVGYVYWERAVTVPPAGKLVFYTGMAAKSPERSDGVWFQVFVGSPAGNGQDYQLLMEHTQKAHEWIRHEVDLGRWQGKRVSLKFVADCGPKDNSTTDQAYWGDVVVAGPETGDKATDPVRYMTWANPQPFTSSFYFSEVRGATVDLEFVIEGSEPLELSRIEAFTAADAMYREFERGLVLANPSPRPYTFDLERLTPGRRYRRLQGVAAQDAQANSGQPVGPTVTLGPKEGLFLVRQK